MFENIFLSLFIYSRPPVNPNFGDIVESNPINPGQFMLLDTCGCPTEFDFITEGNATGKFLYILLDYNIDAATDLKIEITDPCGDQMIKTDITVPNTPLIDLSNPTVILANAGEYMAYEWIETDIPVGSAGEWKAYPSLILDGVYQGAQKSSCFSVLAKDACL